MHKIDINLDDSPPGSTERTQRAIDFFGELIMQLRDEVLEAHGSLLRNAEHRRQLGKIPSGAFETLCKLSDDQIEAVVEVCRQGIDSFTQLLLSYLEHQGSQLRFSDNKLAHFVLLMQVLDFDDRKLVEEHLLNRAEGANFALRWGKWSLHHSKLRKNGNS
jgi:hypothetical protein